MYLPDLSIFSLFFFIFTLWFAKTAKPTRQFSSFFYSVTLLTSFLNNGLWVKSEWQQIPQVSRILLNILANIKNAVVWMVSIFLQISNFPVFRNCSKCISNDWFPHHPHVKQLFLFSRICSTFCILLLFLCGSLDEFYFLKVIIGLVI